MLPPSIPVVLVVGNKPNSVPSVGGVDGASWKANKKRIELLKTPGAMDAQMENMTIKSVSGTSGNLAQEAKNGYLLARLYRMIPTPTAMDATSATATMKSTQVKEGSMHSMTLTRLLCTPTAQASRGNTSDKRGKGNLTDQIAEMDLTTSKTSQLNPRFVAEMMGFPPNWTELPFQSGEQKA